MVKVEPPPSLEYLGSSLIRRIMRTPFAVRDTADIGCERNSGRSSGCLLRSVAFVETIGCLHWQGSCPSIDLAIHSVMLLGGIHYFSSTTEKNYYRLVVWKHLLEVAKLTAVPDFISPDMAESEFMLSSVAEKIKRDIQRRNREILEKSFNLRYPIETQDGSDYSPSSESSTPFSNTLSEEGDYDLEYVNTKFNEISLLASELKQETNISQKLTKTEAIIFIILDVLTKYENEFEEDLLKEVKDFLKGMEANRILYRIKDLAQKNLNTGLGNPLLTLRNGIDSFNLLAEFIQKYWDIQPKSVKEHYKTLAINLYAVDLEVRFSQKQTVYSGVKSFFQDIYLWIVDREKLGTKYSNALKYFISSVANKVNEESRLTHIVKTDVVYKNLQIEVNQKFQDSYILINPLEIYNFIDGNEALQNVLVGTAQIIRQYFNLNEINKLTLELFKNEDFEDLGKLLIYIYTDLDVDSAYDKLSDFKSNLWIDYVGALLPKISVDIVHEISVD